MRTREEVVCSSGSEGEAETQIQVVFLRSGAEVEFVVHMSRDGLGDLGLKTGSVATDITPFIPRLQEKQKDALANMSIIGGRVNRVAIVRARYELDFINYTERISTIEDVDMSEVITNLKMAESVYNAALNGGARIIQPTLMDFMR